MFYTFATQECVYNNLYRCIGMGRWWRNIQQWDGVKCGKTPDQEEAIGRFRVILEENIRTLTHFFYCYFTPPQMHFLVKH